MRGTIVSRSPHKSTRSMRRHAKRRMRSARVSWMSPTFRAIRTAAICWSPTACILPAHNTRAGSVQLRRSPRKFWSFESTGETAGIEKRLLFRRGLAPQRGIAMREAAEAPDDVVMDHCPAIGVRGRQRTIQGQRAFLIGQIFGMFERQIEERAQVWLDRLVESRFDRT